MSNNHHERTLWKVSCLALMLLSAASLSLVFYLKFVGVLLPFSLYDGYLFGFYYFALFLYAIHLCDLRLVEIKRKNVRLWYTNKFLATGVLFVEVRGLLDYHGNREQITNELALEDEATVPYDCLRALNLVRLSLAAIMYFHGHRLLAGKQKMLNAGGGAAGGDGGESGGGRNFEATTTGDYYSFGSMFTFTADCLVIELYLYTCQFYHFNLSMVLLVSLVAYFYYKFARF